MVVGGSLEPVPWGRIGKLARYYLLQVYNFCMYMLNCCRLFFFFGICTRVYCIFSSAFTARICDLDFSDLDFFFLIFCWIARSQAAVRNVQ